MLKISKPGFINTWTVNFQMFKLVLVKTEEAVIKLPTSTGSSKKQETPEKKVNTSQSQKIKANALWRNIQAI